jgi:hypothetical protein
LVPDHYKSIPRTKKQPYAMFQLLRPNLKFPGPVKNLWKFSKRFSNERKVIRYKLGPNIKSHIWQRIVYNLWWLVNIGQILRSIPVTRGSLWMCRIQIRRILISSKTLFDDLSNFWTLTLFVEKIFFIKIVSFTPLVRAWHAFLSSLNF